MRRKIQEFSSPHALSPSGLKAGAPRAEGGQLSQSLRYQLPVGLDPTIERLICNVVDHGFFSAIFFPNNLGQGVLGQSGACA
jgi:hypothetical protein